MARHAVTRALSADAFLQQGYLYWSGMNSVYALRDIVNDDSSTSISDYGAHVLSWTPSGADHPVIWHPRAYYLSEGTAIRGGVPVIFPWFGNGWTDGHVAAMQPKHGFGRLSFWHVDEAASNDHHMRYTLDSSEADAELLDQFRSNNGPIRCHAAYDVETGDSITMSLTVTNDGDEPLIYEAGLHTYIAVGDVERISIGGFESSDYLDNTSNDLPRHQAAGEPITFSGMMDRTYLADGVDTVRITDPVYDRTIVVTKKGAPQAVVWNPGETAGNAIEDLQPGEWRGFVCVESVARFDRGIVLAPGECHTLSQTLSVE